MSHLEWVHSLKSLGTPVISHMEKEAMANCWFNKNAEKLATVPRSSVYIIDV